MARRRATSGGDSPRVLAWRILHQVTNQGLSLGELIDSELGAFEDNRDRAFCAELVFGVCRYYHVLLATLRDLLSRPLKARDQDLSLILLLGIYQLRFMRVGSHAAVNETVKLVAVANKQWAKGLVNGVLRNYARALEASDPVSRQQLSAEEHAKAYPAWLRDSIMRDWHDDAPAVLAAGNVQAPLVLRVDVNRVGRDDYLRRLQQVGIRARSHPVVGSAIVLEEAVPVTSLPGFEQGLVSVQDAAAQLAAGLLDCQSGERVLDACAAPGGKALHILQSVKDLRLLALDKDALRLQRIGDNLTRAGLVAEVLCADAAQPEAWYDGVSFDRILLDAPCSATGIIRRHPDIRLLRRADDIERLCQQQARLLDQLWSLLKPGGMMLYATCSILRDENDRQVEAFLRRQSDCVEVPINTVQWGREANPGRQILPGLDAMDGFYYARLEKKS